MAARVLIVDDHDAIRTMLITVLEAAGYDARGAIDGADALKVLGQWRPDVILLDLQMPEMNGWHFLERKATAPGLSTIPVIVVTAAPLRDVPAAERLGIRAVVSKPHDVGLLRTLVEQTARQTVAGVPKEDP